VFSMASLLDDEMEKKVGDAACSFCLKEEGRYTCPRCNARYCSSACYKCTAHADCSESFYKDCVMDGIKHMSSNKEDKQKMKEMLLRLEQADQEGLDDALDDTEEGYEDEEEDDLASRIEGLDLDKDTDAIWEVLTDKEKQEFQAMLDDGRLGNMIEIWQPWWRTNTENKVVQFAHEETVVKKSSVPKGFKDIIDIKTLLRNSPPADSLCYSVVQVLYAYVYITRFHNGEYMTNVEQAWQDLTKLAPVLKENIIYNDVSGAVQASIVLSSDVNSRLLVSQAFHISVLQDVRDIIEMPCDNQNDLIIKTRGARSMKFVIAALSDLHTLLQSAKQALQLQVKQAKLEQGNVDIDSLRQLRQCCFVCIKKVEFLLSWVTSENKQKLLDCVSLIDVEICSMTSQLTTHNNLKKQINTYKKQRSSQSKSLIEPIS